MFKQKTLKALQNIESLYHSAKTKRRLSTTVIFVNEKPPTLSHALKEYNRYLGVG